MCGYNILAAYPEIDPREVVELDRSNAKYEAEKAKAGWCRHKASLPCVRAEGPLLPVLGAPQDVSTSAHPFGGPRKKFVSTA